MSEHPTGGDGPDKVVHVYDGIEEQDNNLPNWWLGILYGSIVFAFGYWGYYEVFKVAPHPDQEYAQELAALQKQREAQKPAGADGEAALLALLQDEAAVKGGHEVFKASCAACHGMDAQGVIGPNLTDDYWLHGANALEVHRTIATGVVEKGMPAWEPSLGPDRVRQVTAFVLSLKGKNVPGKPPQGEPVQQ